MAGQHDIKDITDVIGRFGPWQRQIFFLVFYVAMLVAWQHMVVPFHAPKMDYWCARPQYASNFSVEEWKGFINGLAPKNDSEHYKCHGPIDVLSNSTQPCKEWEFEHSHYTSTIVEEWNLVCDDSWKVSVAQSSYMVGNLVAAVGLTQLSDRFGRRPMILCSAVILLVAGITCAFSTSFIVFAICRFTLALGTTGLFLNDFVLLMEVIGPTYRPILGVALELGWATGYVLLPGIAYLLHNWVYIQLAITIPVVSLFSLWWLMPESPRWLITKARHQEAEEIVSKACKANGKMAYDPHLVVQKLIDAAEKEKEKNSEKRVTIFHLLKSPKLRRYTLIIFFNWFVNAFIFYGLSLNTNELEGNPFLNFALSGFVEFPAYVIAIIILKHLGRRKPQMAFMVIGGIACIATIPIPNDLLWLRITLAMLGKFCITASYAVIYVYSAEVYPTVVRTVAMGSSSFWSKIGSIIAPFTKELGEYTAPSVPFCLYGGLSIASGLLILLLPETSNKELPDTIQQAENLQSTLLTNTQSPFERISLIDEPLTECLLISSGTGESSIESTDIPLNDKEPTITTTQA